MNIDVILTPLELPTLAKRDLSDAVCVVFDVLRATSTFVTALHNGAAAIVPVCEISEALDIKNKRPRTLTAGERLGVKIRVEGQEFDFGNSPMEFTPEKVKGHTIVSTTTNGTRALRACAHAKTVLAAAFLNLSATANFLREKQFQTVIMVCSGTRENVALEDVVAAGALCDELKQIAEKPSFSDSARVALAAFRHTKLDLVGLLCESENAQRLVAIPELRADIRFCLNSNLFNLVARMKDGKITAIQD